MLLHLFDNPAPFFASIVVAKIVIVLQRLGWLGQMLEPNLPCFVIGFMNLVLGSQQLHLINLETMLDSSIILILGLTVLLMALHLIQHLDWFVYSLKLTLYFLRLAWPSNWFYLVLFAINGFTFCCNMIVIGLFLFCKNDGYKFFLKKLIIITCYLFL